MDNVVGEFAISIDQVADYEFRVRFDKENYPELRMDEPGPLGRDTAPNPSRVLAAAIGNCLCASFQFCARKHGVKPSSIQAEVKVEIVRNESRRLRVGRVRVVIDPRLEAADLEKAKACRALFEDFCTVTQSIRDGVEVDVSVRGMDAG